MDKRISVADLWAGRLALDVKERFDAIRYELEKDEGESVEEKVLKMREKKKK